MSETIHSEMAMAAAWMWLLAQDSWVSFAVDKRSFDRVPPGRISETGLDNAPLLNLAQCEAMDRACEKLYDRGWVRRRRQPEGPGWWYKVDQDRADHLPRTWRLARWLLDGGHAHSTAPATQDVQEGLDLAQRIIDRRAK